MKKILYVGLIALVLVGCSAKKDAATVCTNNDQSIDAQISLVRSEPKNDRLKSINMTGKVEDESELELLKTVSTVYSMIKGIDFKIEKDTINLTVDYDELDLESIQGMITSVLGEYDTSGSLSEDDINERLSEIRSHDFIVENLEEAGFSCTIN